MFFRQRTHQLIRRVAVRYEGKEEELKDSVEMCGGEGAEGVV